MEAFIHNILLINIFTWTAWTTWTNPVFIRACAVQDASMQSTLVPRSGALSPTPWSGVLALGAARQIRRFQTSGLALGAGNLGAA